MPFRYLHCIASVNSEGGGPIEGLRQLAARNAALGHRIEVVSLDAPDDPWVIACPVRCHPLGPGVTPFRYASKLVPWLAQHRHEYDAVIVNGLWQYHSLAVWRALRGTNTPYFVFPHGMLDPWFKRQYPLKHLKKWLFWPWSDYRVLRDARAVLFTSEEERRAARESFWLYRCTERVVNYGTAAPTGDPDAQRAAFRGKFPEVVGCRSLLFLGRVHPKKGADLLIRAFAKISLAAPSNENSSSTNAPLRLIMAGPDNHAYGLEMRALCEELGIAGRVTWTGMLTGDLKRGAFYNATGFVLPSHQENFGIAVAEALACGVPVLISNRVNIWREIEADGAGLVEPDTRSGTERLLERWLELTPDERERMSEQAQKTFVQRYHIEQAAASLIETFREFQVPES